MIAVKEAAEKDKQNVPLNDPEPYSPSNHTSTEYSKMPDNIDLYGAKKGNKTSKSKMSKENMAKLVISRPKDPKYNF